MCSNIHWNQFYELQGIAYEIGNRPFSTVIDIRFYSHQVLIGNWNAFGGNWVNLRYFFLSIPGIVFSCGSQNCHLIPEMTLKHLEACKIKAELLDAKGPTLPILKTTYSTIRLQYGKINLQSQRLFYLVLGMPLQRGLVPRFEPLKLRPHTRPREKPEAVSVLAPFRAAHGLAPLDSL